MYLLVEFSGDPKVYSVVPLQHIVDGSIRSEVKSYIGKKVQIIWGKKHYDVILRDQGSKRSMDILCDKLAIDAAEIEDDRNGNLSLGNSSTSKKSSKRVQTRIDRSESIASVHQKRTKRQSTASSSNVPIETQSGDSIEVVTFAANIAPESDCVTTISTPSNDQRIHELQIKIEKLKSAKKKYRKRLEEQQKMNEDLEKKLKSYGVNKKKIELSEGSGVYLRSSKVAAAKLASKTPSILARNLFRYVFSSEEMTGRSLLGRKCNANKEVSALPAVDPVKRDAIVEFSLKAFNLKATDGGNLMDNFRIHKAKILSSLTKLLREEAKNRN
ncbi:unnamed protein product [Allacma fusca]|uniref:BEN domain-containing protein n=1 Tax=Allacma fusca TaxID=39272 RepID=A0A8J2IY77_9HEXA|nr:unnamed protein product [Allacma fusca]